VNSTPSKNDIASSLKIGNIIEKAYIYVECSLLGTLLRGIKLSVKGCFTGVFVVLVERFEPCRGHGHQVRLAYYSNENLHFKRNWKNGILEGEEIVYNSKGDCWHTSNHIVPFLRNNIHARLRK
jgi:hypothetical protein